MKALKFFSAIIVLSTLVGCSIGRGPVKPVGYDKIKSYSSGRIPASIVEEKGDVKGIAYAHRRVRAIDGFLAYSPIDKLGVYAGTTMQNLQADYTTQYEETFWFPILWTGTSTQSKTTQVQFFKSDFYHFGIGTYRHVKDDVMLEFYADYGFGYLDYLQLDLGDIKQQRVGLIMGIRKEKDIVDYGAQLSVYGHKLQNDHYLQSTEQLILDQAFRKPTIQNTYANLSSFVRFGNDNVKLEIAGNLTTGGRTSSRYDGDISMGLMFDIDNVCNSLKNRKQRQ